MAEQVLQSAALTAAIQHTESALADLRAVSEPGIAADVQALRARAAQQNLATALGGLSEVIASGPPVDSETAVKRSDKILDVLRASGLSPREQRVLERLVDFSAQPTSALHRIAGGKVETVGDLERVPQSAFAAGFTQCGPKTIGRVVQWAASHGVIMPLKEPAR